MQDLLKKSIEIIKSNQMDCGSFVASPSFSTYNYSWLRDGCFIAYSLDKAGEYEPAERFYTWVNDVIKKHSYKVENILKKAEEGKKLEKSDFLNARYTLDGNDEEETGWGNFQLDGYGAWLWGLGEHIERSGKRELIDSFKTGIDLSVKYIESLWYYPNYDVWEENPDRIHTSTLACLYGGLASINKYLQDIRIEVLAKKIRSFILTNCTSEGFFTKYIGSCEVDGSLLWLSVPFNVVDIDDIVFRNTLRKIEKDLLHGSGVHRYREDTYYGGGEWILLSCWLGWCCCKLGRVEDAEKIRKWVESQANTEGHLPEQVCSHMNNSNFYKPWVERWGNVATPLLWSHAMYIILVKALNMNALRG